MTSSAMDPPRDGRLGGAVILTTVAGLFLLAAILQPVSHQGATDLSLFGLGLPPLCLFRRTTGLPCASCGLTRAVVLLVHGRLWDSLAIHPFGVVAAGLGLLLVPPRIAVLRGGQRVWIARWDRIWLYAALAALLLMIAWWALTIGPLLSSTWQPRS